MYLKLLACHGLIVVCLSYTRNTSIGQHFRGEGPSRCIFVSLIALQLYMKQQHQKMAPLLVYSEFSVIVPTQIICLTIHILPFFLAYLERTPRVLFRKLISTPHTQTENNLLS